MRDIFKTSNTKFPVAFWKCFVVLQTVISPVVTFLSTHWHWRHKKDIALTHSLFYKWQTRKTFFNVMLITEFFMFLKSFLQMFQHFTEKYDIKQHFCSFWKAGRKNNTTIKFFISQMKNVCELCCLVFYCFPTKWNHIQSCNKPKYFQTRLKILEYHKMCLIGKYIFCIFFMFYTRNSRSATP